MKKSAVMAAFFICFILLFCGCTHEFVCDRCGEGADGINYVYSHNVYENKKAVQVLEEDNLQKWCDDCFEEHFDTD